MKTKSKLEEKKLTKPELEAREKIINNLKKNKSSLVKRYGKDAEAVMYGRATNIVKKMTKTNTQNNLKELIRKSLMQEADIEVTADRYGEEKALGQAAMMLDVLEDKLKKHDWFYMMSDDNRKYKEGTTQQIEIRKIIKQLEDIGYGEDAKTLFNQYAPDGPDGSTLKMKEGKKAFPDLTGDGKVTKADILKGRGVKLKEEYTEEVDALALTIKDPNEFEKAKQHFESNSDFYPFDINDEFRTFYFQVQDQADADSTEFYLTQELEGETDLQGYYFSIETSPLSEDLDLGHEDNEPHMLKGDLYRIGKYAMELYQMIDGFEGKGEVDFPHWWQSKIIKSKDMLVSAKHYLDFETKEPEIDAMVGAIDQSGALDNVGVEESINEIDKSFQEYSNNELSGYIRELMKQRANAASKRQDSLVDGINRDIKKATHELKKRAQNIKSLTRTDVNEKEGEIDKADILSGELYKLKGKIQDAYFAKIRKFINMGSYEDAEYLLNRVKGQMNEKGLAETIAKKLKENSTSNKKEGWFVKSNDLDTKYIVVHTSEVENKSNRISQIYKDKKTAEKRADLLNKKLKENVNISDVGHSDLKKGIDTLGQTYYYKDSEKEGYIDIAQKDRLGRIVGWMTVKFGTGIFKETLSKS